MVYHEPPARAVSTSRQHEPIQSQSSEQTYSKDKSSKNNTPFTFTVVHKFPIKIDTGKVALSLRMNLWIDLLRRC